MKDTLPTAADFTSTWGRRVFLPPGIALADGGDGLAVDIGKWRSLLQVSAPTLAPGLDSRAIAVYVTAEPVFDDRSPPPVGRRGWPTFMLEGELQTGSGGVTRIETFGMPAVGKAFHLAADSVRMRMRYNPAAYGLDPASTDQDYTMVGWDLRCAAAISGVYPSPTWSQARAFNSGEGAFVAQTFLIPDFAQTCQALTGASTNFDLLWLDVFQQPATGYSGVQQREPAAQYSEPRSFPLAARYVQVRYLGADSSTSIYDFMLRWGRHS